MSYKITSFLILIAGAIIASGVLAPVRASAVGCSGYGCNGTDPAKTGCATNAYIAKRVNFYNTSNRSVISGVYMDVYYSRTCGTNWVRVTSNPFGGVAYKSITVATIGGFREDEADRTYGASYSMQVYAPGSTPVLAWANLYDTTNRIRANTAEIFVY